MPALSPKQLEILKFIHRFIEERGLPPTRGEIAEGLGLRNRQGIDQHLRALKAKGAIELLPGLARGIRIRESGATEIPATHNDERAALSENFRRASPEASLPVLGRIAAGSPIFAVENIEDHVRVDAALFRPHADFLLRVRGDSMKDANIFDRDLLAVHRTSQARNGQIVVARIGDDATVKYYERSGRLVRLQPANPDYSAIEVDLQEQDFSIEGLAVGVIRTGLGGNR